VKKIQIKAVPGVGAWGAGLAKGIVTTDTIVDRPTMATVGMELSKEDADFARILVATTPLEAKHVDELIVIFSYFDTNQDGFLSTDQAILAWRSAAVVYSKKDVRSIKRLTKHQWLRLCGDYAMDEENARRPQDQYITMFKALDFHRREEIKIESLHAYFKTTGLGATLEQTRVLGEAINKYGIGDTVTEEEFVQFMLKREEITRLMKRGGNGSHNADEENEGGNHTDSTVDMQEAFGFY